MELDTAIRTRRSTQYLTGPAPSDDEFLQLLGLASLAPDHGCLQPWRWILLRGEDRVELGARFGQECVEKAAVAAMAKPLRAPLLATLVFSPRPADRIPEWEQLGAAVGVANAMMLLLHDRGYGSIWRTGSYTESPGARDLLEIDARESLLGWLYIGTPDPARPIAPRRPADPVAGKVRVAGLTPAPRRTPAVESRLDRVPVPP